VLRDGGSDLISALLMFVLGVVLIAGAIVLTVKAVCRWR
jgi:hypothetical protein